MKRKLLLFVSILAVLTCLFAISISAAEIDYTEKATLTDGTVVPIYDEDKNPLVWFILSTDENGVNTYASVPTNRNNADNASSYIRFNVNSTYGTNQLHDVYIYYWDAENSKYVNYGEGTTVVLNLREVFFWSVGSYVSNKIEYIYMPESARGSGGYKEFKNLQLIDLSLCTEFSSFPQQAFWGCSALKTVRLADQETPYALDCTYANLFNGCTSLTEITIPDCVTHIGGSAFANCTSLKKVNISENSKITYMSSTSFYNCSSLTAFYLPPLLERIGNSTDGTSGCFQNCTNLYFVNNPSDTERPDVYYFPANFGKPTEDGAETFTYRGFTNTNISETVVLGKYYTKLLETTFNSTPVKNVICLGEMTSVNYVSGKNPTIYLCNENQTSTDGVTVSNPSRYTLVICNAPDNTSHLLEKTLSTEATCENPKMLADYCFCGAIIGDPQIDGEALGHNYTGNVSYAFTSLTEAGKKCTVCVNNCGIDKEEALAPVYTALGVSVNEFSSSPYSFSSGYEIDKESLEIYEREKGVTLKFGYAFNSAADFTEGEVTLDSFKLKTTVVNQTVDYKFDRHDFVMSYTTDEHLAKDIIIAAFVVETKGEAETVSFVNRNDDTTVGVNGFEVTSYQKELAKITPAE